MVSHDPVRFPVGPFSPNPTPTPEERSGHIQELARFPSDFRALVSSLSAAQLDTPYREGGWTARQVIHHVPDSHLQGYVRFKLAVTEDEPTIKTYDQAAWGETEDARKAPPEVSLDLLDALHGRWVMFLRSLREENFRRAYIHPEMGRVTLDSTLQLYVWHGRHHTGHLRRIAEGG